MAQVMVVDDSRTSRRIMRDIIENMGWTVAGEAVNGKDALEKYEELRPDVVTMDITMPIMDGITALDEICSSHPDAKVVMVSSTGQKNKITECIRLGASDYITKPYEPRDVAAVLTKVLGTLHE